MPIESTTAQKVCRFIADEGGITLDQVVLQASLQDLLGWQGDDADDLLMKFAKKFRVDLKGFPFTRYFHSESECIVTGLAALGLVKVLAKWIFGINTDSSHQSPEGEKKPLFIWQLVEAAEKGYWPHEAEMADR